jgi:hypothetical protein
MKMEIGNYVKTPRFLNVRISAILETAETARAEGFTEPTHYDNADYDIYGKHSGMNRMTFAAIRKA